jgi:hypothetical protein
MEKVNFCHSERSEESLTVAAERFFDSVTVSE